MRRTHRHVVAVAPLGVLRFWWIVNNDVTEPAIYAVVLAMSLGYRLAAILNDRRQRAGLVGEAPVLVPCIGPAAARRPST